MEVTAPKQPFNWHSFLLCVVISLGQFVGAYNTVIIGTTYGKKDFMTHMGLWDGEGNPKPNLSALEGAVTGLFQAGAFFGCLISAAVMDRWGRKMAVIVGAIVSIPGLAGMTGSMNVTEFLVFRFISGMGTWISGTAASAYIPELAPAARRGFYSGMSGVVIGLGVTVASYVGMGFYFSDNLVAQWRAPMGFPLFCPILLLAAVPFLPESPRYLLLKDRPEEARKVFDKLHAGSFEDTTLLEEEWLEMTVQISHERELDHSWMSLFTKPTYRKRIILGCMLAFLNQSTAVLVLNNYGQTFYKTLGFSPTDRQLFQGNRDIIALFGNLFGSWLIDYFGRKSLILFSYCGCLLTVIFETMIVAVYAGTDNSAAQAAGVALFYIFLAFYSVGIDVGTYVYLGEMFPNHIRVKGVALSLATLNVTSTVYPSVAATAFANIGWKFFLVFICATLVGIVWIIVFIPETKGVPLEEIEAIFGNAQEVVFTPQSHHVKGVDDGEKGMTEHIEQQ